MLVGLGAGWALRERGFGSQPGAGSLDRGGMKGAETPQSKPPSGSAHSAVWAPLAERGQKVGENDGGSRIEVALESDERGAIPTVSAPPAVDASGKVSQPPLHQQAGPAKSRVSTKKTRILRMKGQPYSTKGTAIVE